MVDEETEPTPDELREAEALARALDGRSSATPAPQDALETAALLRYARDGGALAPERERALAARVRATWRSRRARVLTSALAGSLALAASLLLLLRTSSPALDVPAPPLTLLSAQARAAAREPGALGALDAETQRHRRALHARLGLASGESR